MVFGVFSPGGTQCIAPKKLPDKAMSIWNLHKKFQLSSAMGLRDFDLQSQPTLMGGNPLIVVQCLQLRRFFSSGFPDCGNVGFVRFSMIVMNVITT